MKEIKLTQCKVTIVDDEDFEMLSAVKWYALRSGRTFYAERIVYFQGGGRRHEFMHRVVLTRKLGRAITEGMDTDHDDGNGLNNQRENLLEVTRRGNIENLHIAKSSQYLGVSWIKRDKKWRAQIMASGKVIRIGCYATELEAALARESYVAEHPELLASSNFSQGRRRPRPRDGKGE
jgi:hypothetical protein